MPNIPVIIHDIIVVTKDRRLSSPIYPTGEFGRPELFGGIVYHDEQAEKTIQRLLNHIEALALVAKKEHTTNCCLPDGNPDPSKENEITRLVTNEFYFYTAAPLTIPLFEILMQELMTLVDTLPPNIHLVLGTFAIKTPDNQVMNVAPLIESGKNAQLRLVVKNYPSDNDPLYNEAISPTFRELLPNLRAKHGEEELPYYITINQKHYHFSFNNVIVSRTQGGIQFLSCIEICLDHFKAVAQKKLAQYLDRLVNTMGESSDFNPPLFCSHVVISNTVAIQPKNSLGVVTQADPAHSFKVAKKGAKLAARTWLNSFSFGCTSDILILEPATCDYLIMHAVKSNNMNWLKYLVSHGSDLNFEIVSGKKILNPILLAAMKGHLHIVDYLVSNHSIHPDYTHLAICYAAVKEHQPIVELLLNHGVDINNCRVEGLSIIDIMVYNDQIEMLAYLVQRGADLSRENEFKHTPIKTAEIQDNRKMVKFLKEMQKHQSHPRIPSSSSSSTETPAIQYSPTTELLSHLAPWRSTTIHVLLNNNVSPDLIVLSKSRTVLEEICDNLIILYGNLEDQLNIDFSMLKVWEGFSDEDYHITIPNILIEEMADALDLYLELIIKELDPYNASLKADLTGLEIEASAPRAESSMRF